MGTPAFERLHPDIQRALWDMQWTELRAIQSDAIHHVLDARGDLLIAASTASGKTEAAFLPVLSRVAESNAASIQALYVGPLKALINDQFRRLESLCERASIAVHRWHGDVPANAKQRLIDHPSGVLLITPESIESLFINRPAYIRKVLAELQFVVVDEVHAFLGTERGIHLRSLLLRIDQKIDRSPIRIGLSATAGDPRVALEWLRPRAMRRGDVIRDTGVRELKVGLKAFGGILESADPRAPSPEEEMVYAIYGSMKGRRNLIFGNQKGTLELYTDALNLLCDDERRPREFLIHHGSLAKDIREDVERRMQNEEEVHSVLCTSTLELGIDIGHVESVGQVDPPGTVSSLLQRVGRSGRRDDAPSVLRFFVAERPVDAETPLWTKLYPRLLQAIALVELMAEKRVATPDTGLLHYSTLVQQILSTIAERGGISAAGLYETLITKGAFDAVTKDELLSVFRSLYRHCLIDQMGEGDLILGVDGERLVRRQDFYAAFMGSRDFAVLADGRLIGMLPLAVPIDTGQHLLLGGKRWVVLGVDIDRREILVTGASGKKKPLFTGAPPDVDVEVRERMRLILTRNDMPRFADGNAHKLLLAARETAAATGTGQRCVVDTTEGAVVFAWSSDRVQRTLFCLARAIGLDAELYDVAVVLRGISASEAARHFVNRAKSVSPSQLADAALSTVCEKYDEYLPDEMRERAYVHNQLDVARADAVLHELARTSRPRISVVNQDHPLGQGPDMLRALPSTAPHSPTALTAFLGCRHLASLDRLVASGVAQRPYSHDPLLEVLRERGVAHERAYVERLRGGLARVAEIARDGGSSAAAEATLGAMREGADAIVQARLVGSAWSGWADVLLKKAGSSRFGAYRYEPVETKLAPETRGATLVQLCAYAAVLEELQGAAPEHVWVVTPDTAFTEQRYRLDDYRAYFNWIVRQFHGAMSAPLAASVATAEPYPEPVAQCDFCDWYRTCDARRRADDHLSLVANIQKTQRKELESWGIKTLTQLANEPTPLTRKPSRGTVSSLEKARAQALVQLETARQGRLVHEAILPIEPGFGLTTLPEPSPLDVFLDLEGDRLAEHGGCDYLFGYATLEGSALQYRALWAKTPSEERAAFERLMDEIVQRRARDPKMHVYHYAPYEPTAMKRLMGRYGTRADELDDLLRGHVFVDLFSVVKRAVRVGVESYSIKKLEPLYAFTREVELAVVNKHLRTVEYAIAKGEAETLRADVLAAVEGYNRDDCVSALSLRDWLEAQRKALEDAGTVVPRPKHEVKTASEKTQAYLAKIRPLVDALLEGVPDANRTPDQQARWLLAHLLDWHRREENVSWWEIFRLNGLDEDAFHEAPAAIAGLEHVQTLERRSNGLIDEVYSFPPQDCDVGEGDELSTVGEERPLKVGTVLAIDRERRRLTLRKVKKAADLHPRVLFDAKPMANEAAKTAMMMLAERARDHGLTGPGELRAARDLLTRGPPRLRGGGPLRDAGEPVLDAAIRAVLALDESVLAIQGPPGAGKTYTGARMVLALVRAGKRVGISAGSHKVIRKLLQDVVEAAAGDPAVTCMHKVSDDWSDPPDAGIDDLKGDLASDAISAGRYAVAGGTVWCWSSTKITQPLDVLFIDEAGQMSLANVLAASRGAKNLVLLGDPQQLEQPQKASHPDGCGVSALEHLLGEHATMPEGLGLFLGETRRMHPDICAYTSEVFYERKLSGIAALERQRVSGPTQFAGTGLFYVPVAHEHNLKTSREEAEAVARIVRELTAPGVAWTNDKGTTAQMNLDDVLVVAPYNAQVTEIATVLPGARVGTVDKFQGQEAAVVIYSMATSRPEDAPRGMEFLFSRNRLNVATSRARCICILVGNPALFEPECKTPAQMRMANAFCRYLELARTISI